MPKSYNQTYYQLHKESRKQYTRDRYIEKKDEINKKIICEKCGRSVVARMYKKHLETYIHHREGILLTPIKYNKYKKVDKCIKIEPTPSQIKENLKKNGWVVFE